MNNLMLIWAVVASELALALAAASFWLWRRESRRTRADRDAFLRLRKALTNGKAAREEQVNISLQPHGGDPTLSQELVSMEYEFLELIGKLYLTRDGDALAVLDRAVAELTDLLRLNLSAQMAGMATQEGSGHTTLASAELEEELILERARAEELQERLDGITPQLEQLTAEAEAAKQGMALLEQELAALRAEQRQLTGERDDVLATVNALVAEYGKQRGDLAVGEVRMNELVEAIRALRAGESVRPSTLVTPAPVVAETPAAAEPEPAEVAADYQVAAQNDAQRDSQGDSQGDAGLVGPPAMPAPTAEEEVDIEALLDALQQDSDAHDGVLDAPPAEAPPPAKPAPVPMGSEAPVPSYLPEAFDIDALFDVNQTAPSTRSLLPEAAAQAGGAAPKVELDTAAAAAPSAGATGKAPAAAGQLAYADLDEDALLAELLGEGPDAGDYDLGVEDATEPAPPPRRGK